MLMQLCILSLLAICCMSAAKVDTAPAQARAASSVSKAKQGIAGEVLFVTLCDAAGALDANILIFHASL
jgi:hypothetical protein